MSEITTLGKVGLALMIVASCIVTVFCVFGVVNTFSKDYLEEQTMMFDRTETELQDIVGVYLPTLAINQAVQSSKYGTLNQILCTYEEYGYKNGAYSPKDTVLCEKVAWDDFLKEFTGSTACVTKIEGNDSSLHLYVKIGG